VILEPDGVSISVGSPVVVYLQAPKEKMWGILVSVTTAGLTVRGLDLRVFDDWMRQEARDDDALIGVNSIFFPMHRIERMELDETVGSILGYAARFEEHVGRSASRAIGWTAAASRPPRSVPRRRRSKR